MTRDDILEHLCNSDLDCLSDNELDDYEDDVVDKTWTSLPTNRHAEPYNQRESNSSSDKEEISFDQNVGVSQPSTSAKSTQLQKTVPLQNKNSRPTIQWCEINERLNLESGSTEWLGCANFGEPLDTPAQYFIKYFTPELLQTFSKETNKCYCRTTGQSLRTTSQEVQKVFGISILMANLKFPTQRMYWCHVTRIERIASAMPVNRFQKFWQQYSHQFSCRCRSW